MPSSAVTVDTPKDGTSHRRTTSASNAAVGATPSSSKAGLSNSSQQTRFPPLTGTTPAFELTNNPLIAPDVSESSHEFASHSSSRTPSYPLISSQSSPAISSTTSPRPISGSPARSLWPSGWDHDARKHRPSSPDHASTATYSAQHASFASRQLAANETPLSASQAHERTRTPPSRTGSAQSKDAPKRQDSIGRSTVHAAQSLMERVGARASPTLRRAPLRADSKRNDSNRSVDDEDEIDGARDSSASSGDEADKGHGREHHFSRRSFGSFSQRRVTPALIRTQDPLQRRGSGRQTATSPFSPAHDSYPRSASVIDGRRTPAKYRPDLRSKTHDSVHPPDGRWTISTPLQRYHANPVAESPFARNLPAKQTSVRHSAIDIDGSGKEAEREVPGHSPLFVPQARRGGLNLKARTSKKTSRRSSGSRGLSTSARRPFFETLCSTTRSVGWHLIHPIHTTRVLNAFAWTFLREMDAAFRDPATGERCWRPKWIGAYVPLLIWLVVSISSTALVLIFHNQVFNALNELSKTLQRLGTGGRMVLGSLIFLTTFPPLPLYSTLIVLCGYSFGLWQGFVVSYIAALSGAVAVFLLSKSFLKGWMTGLLAKSGGLKKVVRAIEKRPKLLFLIRLAPYPYNLMNTLLASSPTLTFKTYFACTALALPKLLVHCAIGTSIKNFASYHGAAKSDSNGKQQTESRPATTAESVKKVVGIFGVFLCVGIFLYLFSVARKAVDDELSDGDDYTLIDGFDEDDSDDRREGEYRTHRNDRPYEMLDMELYTDEEEEDLDSQEASDIDVGATVIARGGIAASTSAPPTSNGSGSTGWPSFGTSQPSQPGKTGQTMGDRHKGMASSMTWLKGVDDAGSFAILQEPRLADTGGKGSTSHAEAVDSLFRIASPEHDDSIDTSLQSPLSLGDFAETSASGAADLSDQIALMEAEAERHCTTLNAHVTSRTQSPAYLQNRRLPRPGPGPGRRSGCTPVPKT